jgi:prepilin-type N-terminal cleavage/methylation domain-containing protein
VKKSIEGFTLFEIIVAMAIFSILSLGIFQFIGNTQQVSDTISLSTTAQEDLRDAAAIIADEVQRAYYIFPPCGVYTTAGVASAVAKACGAVFPTTGYVLGQLNVNYSKFTLGASGPTTLSPGTTPTRTWEVGASTNAPILAMIVAPRNPELSCTVPADWRKACYYFVAFYPVLRSGVSASSYTDTSHPEWLDYSPSNKDQWVLMEYRELINDPLLASTSTSYATQLTNVIVTGLGTVSFPGISWDYAGCITGSTCASGTNVPLTPPSADPKNAIQVQEGNIPALYKGTNDSYALARFTARMNLTASKIGGGSGNILAGNIEPNTGFKIDYVSSAIDERGVTEVRILLQMGVFQGSRKTLYPATPLEIYASPRNVPPASAGN